MAEVIGTTFTDDVDRLTARLDALGRRIAEMEARVADVHELALLVPDQGDLIDARVRSAQVSADVHMVALELRSELRHLRGDAPEEAEAPDAPDTGSSAEELAGRLIDLTGD